MFPPRRIVVCFKSPTVFTRDTSRMIFLFTLFCCLTLTASAFQTGPSRSLQKHNYYSSPPANLPSTTTSTRSSWTACSRLPRVTTTRLNFMGSDGGLLGVGTPELVSEFVSQRSTTRTLKPQHAHSLLFPLHLLVYDSSRWIFCSRSQWSLQAHERNW